MDGIGFSTQVDRLHKEAERFSSELDRVARAPAELRASLSSFESSLEPLADQLSQQMDSLTAGMARLEDQVAHQQQGLATRLETLDASLTGVRGEIESGAQALDAELRDLDREAQELHGVVEQRTRSLESTASRWRGTVDRHLGELKEIARALESARKTAQESFQQLDQELRKGLAAAESAGADLKAGGDQLLEQSGQAVADFAAGSLQGAQEFSGSLAQLQNDAVARPLTELQGVLQESYNTRLQGRVSDTTERYRVEAVEKLGQSLSEGAETIGQRQKKLQDMLADLRSALGLEALIQKAQGELERMDAAAVRQAMAEVPPAPSPQAGLLQRPQAVTLASLGR